MKKHQKQILALAVILVFTATILVLTGLSAAGKNKPDPVMTMIEDIIERPFIHFITERKEGLC